MLDASGSQSKDCSLVHRCTEFLVLPFQRNTEIAVRGKTENSKLGV